MNAVTLFLVLVIAGVGVAAGYWVSPYIASAFFVAAAIVALSLKMANVWQKFVILRMGKLQSVRGAGMFAIIPILDSVVAVIDERIQTTAFNAEQALTKDTVPVNVDAIIFWHVHDAQKAALAITDFREAIDRVAQTSLREMIGASMLAALLSDRKEADERLKEEIAAKTAPWGISVSSVEIRDVAIPVALQDAMSRQAVLANQLQAAVAEQRGEIVAALARPAHCGGVQRTQQRQDRVGITERAQGVGVTPHDRLRDRLKLPERSPLLFEHLPVPGDLRKVVRWKGKQRV